MKTFKVTYKAKEIKSIEEIDRDTLFISLMYDVFSRKSTLEGKPLSNVISCSDMFGNSYAYVMADTIEHAFNYVKNGGLENE